MANELKAPLPTWLKLLVAANVSGALVVGGQKLASDSPVHFGVVGEAPSQAEGWSCAPEGGIYGAPMVCRFKADATTFDPGNGGVVDSSTGTQAP